MDAHTVNDENAPNAEDTALWMMKGCLDWTDEDRRAEKEYRDREYSGRFHHLGATVRVIATGEIGTIQQINEPWVGGEFCLREQPGRFFAGRDLEPAA